MGQAGDRRQVSEQGIPDLQKGPHEVKGDLPSYVGCD